MQRGSLYNNYDMTAMSPWFCNITTSFLRWGAGVFFQFVSTNPYCVDSAPVAKFHLLSGGSHSFKPFLGYLKAFKVWPTPCKAIGHPPRF